MSQPTTLKKRRDVSASITDKGMSGTSSQAMNGGKQSKYRNRIAVYERGNKRYKFHSKRERDRFIALLARQDAGEIIGLDTQPKFLLQERFRDEFGELYKAIYYIADFIYVDKLKNETIVEDVKGVQTAVFRLKRAMFARRYPGLRLVLVK